MLIEVKHLRKTFRIVRRQAGMMGALRSIFRRDYIEKHAVDDVSFSIGRGEMVGYIGPNGAGKSTTIKILTGILVPTSGTVRVDGIVPYRQRMENARQIGVVFGQRTQLWWDLPTIESFELLRSIYGIPEDRYRRNLSMFTEILGLDQFLDTPVRQLSLGQRMRADLAASLLHEPPILYLDEPTIGLDVVAKEHMRRFIQEINREKNVTVILTTHDMADIERLCQRMILIDHGKIVYDGSLAHIKETYGRERILVVDFDDDVDDGDKFVRQLQLPGTSWMRRDGRRHWIRFDRKRLTAGQLIERIGRERAIRDITLEEPEIEAIIRQIYEHGL